MCIIVRPPAARPAARASRARPSWPQSPDYINTISNNLILVIV